MNLLNNYVKVLTVILLDGKPFEDVVAAAGEGWSRRLKSKVYKIVMSTVWELYMKGISKKDALVHVDIDHQNKRLRVILFMDKRLYDGLFGKYIKEQQMRELAKLIRKLQDRIWDVDWIEFILEIEEDK